MRLGGRFAARAHHLQLLAREALRVRREGLVVAATSLLSAGCASSASDVASCPNDLRQEQPCEGRVHVDSHVSTDSECESVLEAEILEEVSALSDQSANPGRASVPLQDAVRRGGLCGGSWKSRSIPFSDEVGSLGVRAAPTAESANRRAAIVVVGRACVSAREPQHKPRDLNALGEVNVVLPTRIRLRDVYGAIGGHDRHAASIGIGALSLMMIWLRCDSSRES